MIARAALACVLGLLVAANRAIDAAASSPDDLTGLPPLAPNAGKMDSYFEDLDRHLLERHEAAQQGRTIGNFGPPGHPGDLEGHSSMEDYMNANYQKWKEAKYGTSPISHLPDHIAVERGGISIPNPLNLITYPIGWGLYILSFPISCGVSVVTWPFRV